MIRIEATRYETKTLLQRIQKTSPKGTLNNSKPILLLDALFSEYGIECKTDQPWRYLVNI